MLEQHFRRERVRERIRSNPIADYITKFVAYLDRRGHSSNTIQSYVQAVEHFGRWLGDSGPRDAVISRNMIRDFIWEHLPRCSCELPAPCHRKNVHAALMHLLRAVDSSVAYGLDADDPVTRLLDQHNEHLQRNGGLAEATRLYRLRYARQFLQSATRTGENLLASLKPQDIMDFVAATASRCRRSSVQVAACSLRSFLQFLHFRGLCDAGLIRAVPRIPQWRLSGVPRTMTEEQITRFLDSFDHSTPTGCRDYAMALCMVELGLRVSEVAGIELSDLDWRRSVLVIKTSKGRRVRQLPISGRTGESLAGYLRNGRPESSCRNVFLRHTVPVGTAVTRELVRGVMRRAYARSGCPEWTGTHVLRHTAASRVHQRGASLKEVADLLGHRSIDTSQIYVKVNLTALRAVALPWPEVQS